MVDSKVVSHNALYTIKIDNITNVCLHLRMLLLNMLYRFFPWFISRKFATLLILCFDMNSTKCRYIIALEYEFKFLYFLFHVLYSLQIELNFEFISDSMNINIYEMKLKLKSITKHTSYIKCWIMNMVMVMVMVCPVVI